VKGFAPRKRSLRVGKRSGPQRSGSQQDGYILLTLLLVLSLMAILALAVITPIKFSMQRDQEQEMVHRGVQYSRAIRGYYKKFGRYPTKLEDLDNTNNLRYIRKRYKDPLTGQDFKLLHYGDQGVTLAGGIGGGLIPGASPAGAPTGMNGASSGSSSSAFGGSSFGGSTFGSSGANGSGVNSSGVFSQSSGPGGNSNSAFGGNSNSQTPAGQAGTDAAPGQDSSLAGSQNSQQGSSPTGGSAFGSSAFGSSSSNGQVIGGGPIVGVASTSKKTSIREYNKKKKYNEWQFVYDPTADHGGLITTPYQPMAIQGMGSQGIGTPAGQSGNGSQPGSPGNSPFGQSSTFGNSPNGFGNNQGSGGTTQPAQPPANPQQPQ
jgi:type II secretory pathway pseudopilin PulG